MITLLGKPTSINVRKVLWLCAELDLPVDLQPWGSGHRDTQLPAFLALNPNGLVPVLRDGDFTLWESNSICRYLAAREQRTDLLPTAPRKRALVEQWMDWQATELNNAWRYIFMALVRQDPRYDNKTEMQNSVASWNRHMRILDDQLARSGAFVAGEKFTLADIVLGLSACRWQLAPIERPPLAAVANWQARLATRPGYQLHADNGMG
ncbi:MAG: glutathione S-transferase [Rubrivivax sp.]|nr:glutathione S-transferase [Rubrivivax sp.]MDP3225549.1 glutathione S-transferase [Rubrivivax sp.]